MLGSTLIVDGIPPRLTQLSAAVAFAILHWEFRTELKRLKALRAGQTQLASASAPFVLFLRSFANTEGYERHGRIVSHDGVFHVVESIVGEIEAAVRASGARLAVIGGELIAPWNHATLWLRCSDATWTSNFRTLALHAQGIVLCPELSPGIASEVEFIRERRLLYKTIVLMLPTPREEGLVHYPDRQIREQRWHESRRLLEPAGLSLPPYDPAGRLFGVTSHLHQGTLSIPLADEPTTKRSWWRSEARGPSNGERAIATWLDGLAGAGTPFDRVHPHLELLPPETGPVSLLTVPGSDRSFARAVIMVFFVAASLLMLAVHVLLPAIVWSAVAGVAMAAERISQRRRGRAS
jgi:hypothetical protein